MDETPNLLLEDDEFLTELLKPGFPSAASSISSSTTETTPTTTLTQQNNLAELLSASTNVANLSTVEYKSSPPLIKRVKIPVLNKKLVQFDSNIRFTFQGNAIPTASTSAVPASGTKSDQQKKKSNSKTKKILKKIEQRQKSRSSNKLQSTCNNQQIVKSKRKNSNHQSKRKSPKTLVKPNDSVLKSDPDDLSIKSDSITTTELEISEYSSKLIPENENLSSRELKFEEY